MPTRDTAPIGAPCWVDLMTSDTERSRTFYCQLFGWTAEDPAEEFGGYFNWVRLSWSDAHAAWGTRLWA
jgi:predicted enzyme related to lactoylglutathione lyase